MTVKQILHHWGNDRLVIQERKGSENAADLLIWMSHQSNVVIVEMVDTRKGLVPNEIITFQTNMMQTAQTRREQKKGENEEKSNN